MNIWPGLDNLTYYRSADGTVIALALPSKMGDESGVIPPPTIEFYHGPIPKTRWVFNYQGSRP